MKYKYALYGTIVLLLLMGGCGPSAEQIATMTASAWTPTPIPTLTPTPTPTPTPIPYDLTVTITDEAGTPIAGASIVIPDSGSAEPVQTDGQGRYNWNNLPGEAVNLNVVAQGYFAAQQTATLQRGPNAISIALKRDPSALLPSQACAAGEKPLYIEDFQDGKAAGWPEIEMAVPGWKIVPDPENAANTLLTAIAEAPRTSYNRDAVSYVNVVWRIKYMYTGKGGTFFNFRFTESPEQNAYYITGGIYSHLTRMQNGQRIHLKNFPVIKADTWYLLEIGYFDSNLSIWLDGKNILEWQDPHPWDGGTINLEPHIENSGMFYYDDISVCELTAPMQPLPPTTP